MKLIANFFSLIFFLLLALSGVYTSWQGAIEWQHACDSVNWPTTHGKIVSTEIKEYRSKTTSYDPVITYRYQINKRYYSSNKLQFSPTHGNIDYARAKLLSYPIGQEVTIYYDPDEPEISCLVPGSFGLRSYQFIILGGVLTFFCLLPLLRSVLRALRRHHSYQLNRINYTRRELIRDILED